MHLFSNSGLQAVPFQDFFQPNSTVVKDLQDWKELACVQLHPPLKQNIQFCLCGGGCCTLRLESLNFSPEGTAGEMLFGTLTCL